MKIHPEQLAMITVFDWVRLHKLDKFIWHTANERKCSFQYGFLLKKMGVIPGITDITVARARHGYNGAYIEVKVGKNKPTLTQIQFMETMASEGYFTKTTYGVDETINTIRNYLEI